MKKIVALLLVVVMMVACVACGENKGNAGNNNGGATVEIADALEVLTKAWDEYKASAGEDLQFMIGGSNAETLVMDAPGKFDLTLEYATDELTGGYCVPADAIAKIDDVATMMNMMMGNNFTSAAVHVASPADVEAVVGMIKDATVANQWMCGMPEKLVIITLGDYVVTAFGLENCIDAYKTAITTVYGDAAVISVEEGLLQ